MATKLSFESHDGMAALLRGFSAEVTSGDRKSIDAAAAGMPPGGEVFIASLPSDTGDRQLLAAAALQRAGLTPVPHIVARNIPDLAHLERLLGRFADEAGVRRALVLAGDRDQPAGELHSSLQLIESGSFGKFGIRQIAVAAHPEEHPRVPTATIVEARRAKVAAAAHEGLELSFVSQFCFESAPIIALARELRAEGIAAPLRVGIAGPASRTSLMKYALMCGIGPSLRALKERQNAARNMLTGETPEELLRDVAAALAADPKLGIEGVHFFTFGSLAATLAFVKEHTLAG
jgi:methylenetetrahydrofolate reductase (NADPH)